MNMLYIFNTHSPEGTLKQPALVCQCVKWAGNTCLKISVHGVPRGDQPDLFLRKGVPFTYQLDHNPFLTLSTSCMHITLQIGLLIWQLLCNVGVCCCVKQWQAALSQHPKTVRVECQKYNWQHCFCKRLHDRRLFTSCGCGKTRDKRQVV